MEYASHTLFMGGVAMGLAFVKIEVEGDGYASSHSESSSDVHDLTYVLVECIRSTLPADTIIEELATVVLAIGTDIASLTPTQRAFLDAAATVVRTSLPDDLGQEEE